MKIPFDHSSVYFHCACLIVVAVFWMGASASAQLVQNPDNGHYYEVILVEEQVSWEAAQADAVCRGGYLVTLTSSAENDFVFENLVDNPEYWLQNSAPFQNQLIGPWIGAFQPSGSPEPAGNWQWVNGEGLLSDTFWGWLPDEPNNFGTEDFASYFDKNSTTNRSWNDSGGSRISYVVEYDEIPMRVPETVALTRGTYVSGDRSELCASDNEDYSLQRRSGDIQSRTEFEVVSNSPFASPTSMTVRLEAAVFARSPVQQSIELFDYDSSQWELVDSRPASRFSDSTVIVTPTGNLARFIESNSLEISARIRFQSLNPRQQFSSNTDHFVWEIE